MSAIAGRVLLIGKGEYSASVTYHPLDWVTYGSSSYCSKATTLGNLPTDTDYWQVMAKGIETPAEIGIGIGTCSTAAATVAKTATLTDYELTVNGIVAVSFTNAVPANATLNINSEGAKPIFYQGSAIVDQVIRAGYTATFAYDGTNYVLLCVDKSAGHEIKNSSGTTMTQRSALKFEGGASVTDDSTNDQTVIKVTGHTVKNSSGTAMTDRASLKFTGNVSVSDDSTNDQTIINIEGSGHTIEDSSGTSMTQRSVLQFGGTLQVTDNSTDGATVVDDSAFEISWDDWDAMSAAEQDAFCELHPKVDILDPPSVDGTISAELMKKLWENPSPTSDFNSQTIALSSSDYDFLLWVIKTGKNEAYQYVQISNKANGLLSLAYSTSGGANSEYRDFTLDTATSITLSNCKKAVGTTAQTTANDRMIPISIYGIKSTINLKLSAIASDVNTAADHCMLSDGVTSVEDKLDELNEDKVNKEWILAGSVDSASQSGGGAQRTTTVTVPNTATEVLLQITLGSNVLVSTLGFVTSDSLRSFAYRVASNAITDYILAQYTKSTGQLLHMWVSGTEYTGTSAKLYYR